MQHSFNVELAKKYGILEAVLLNHLWFWIKKNKANNANYFDGSYWTFNSTKAFSELFPYASERQIKYALKHLREEEIIKVGNYNKDTRDRTLWYAFTEKGKAIVQNCPMESSFLSDTKVRNVRALPDINTDINTDNNINNKEERKKETNYDKIINSMVEDEEVKNSIYEFIKMRKLIKKPMTDRALTMLINKLEKLSSDKDIQIKILEKSILKNWTDIYELKGDNIDGNIRECSNDDGSEYAEFV